MAVTSLDHTRQIRSLPLPAGGAIAATSSLTGVLMTNVPGGDEHDEALLQRYGPRVRRSEP
jgi:hypothetical protein